MVATFLDESAGSNDDDDLDLEYRWPRWSEVVGVVTLAVRLRLGGAGAPIRSVVWGEAGRLVALLWLLAHSSLTVLALAAVTELPLQGALLSTSLPWAVGVVIANLVELGSVVFATPLSTAGWLNIVVTGRLIVWVPVLALVCSFHLDAPPVPRCVTW